MNKLSWTSEKFGKFITTLTDYHANGAYKTLKANVTLLDEPDYAVMIRTTNFEKNDFAVDLKYVSQRAYDFLSKSKVLPGDILMNKIANPGTAYSMPDLGRPVSLAMNLFLIRTDPEKLDQNFAYYYLRANEEYVKSFSTGAATATITKDAVRNLDITVPPIQIQKRISSILAAYDQSIEVNRKRLQALDRIGRLMFEEWFVRHRFPDSLINSDVKTNPKDWRTKYLAEQIDFVRGVEPGSKSYKNTCEGGLMPFLRVGDLGKQKSTIFIEDSLANGKILEPEDIAITMDGTVGLVETGLFGAYSSGIRKIVPRSGCVLESAFIYYLLRSDQIQGTIVSHAKGTTIKHASSSIQHLVYLHPPTEVLKEFEKRASPLLKQKRILEKQSEQLAKARDLLLPRLMDGSLEV